MILTFNKMIFVTDESMGKDTLVCEYYLTTYKIKIYDCKYCKEYNLWKLCDDGEHWDFLYSTSKLEKMGNYIKDNIKLT